MSNYLNVLNGVLGRIERIVSVDKSDYNGDGEWIRLEAEHLDDSALYSAIAKKWGRTAGYINKFALLYCHTGNDAGVWLHYLSTPALRAEYRVGCFSVPTWE